MPPSVIESENKTNILNKVLVEEQEYEYEYEPEPIKINIREEITLLFFNSMLDCIVDEWVPLEQDNINDDPCVCSLSWKTFKDLEEEDLIESNILSVEGSMVSLYKKESPLEQIKLSKKHRKESKGSKELKTSKEFKETKDTKEPKDGKETKDSKETKDTKESKKKGKGEKKKHDKMKTISVDVISDNKSWETLTMAVPNDWILNPPDENVSIRFKNGNTYEGKVSRKMFHGKGTFCWADGAKYTGEFVNGEIIGRGILTFTDLSWYDGEVYKGYRHGYGSMCLSGNPQLYSGNWKCGKKHGRGWMLYKSGDWYDGEWDNCLRHGFGSRRYSTGDRYVGHWKDGQRHGTGCMLWTNQDVYNGEWENGNRQGFGEYIWRKIFNQCLSFPMHNSYKGTWEKGDMHGVGIMYFGMEGGARLAGCWQNNQKHGAGVIVCENGQIVESNPLFLKDKPVHITDDGLIEFYDLGDPNSSSTPLRDDSVEILEKQDEEEEFSTIVSQKKNLNSMKPSSTSTTVTTINNVQSNPSSLLMIITQINSKVPSHDLNKSIKENIEINRNAFPTVKHSCKSLLIPLQINDAHIVVKTYIDKAAELLKLHNGSFNITNMEYYIGTYRSKVSDMELSSNAKDCNLSYCSKSKTTALTIEDTCYLEEKWLRNTILLYLPRLRKLYDSYASVACLENPPSYRPTMVRMFLWQLYRDCNIPKKGLSLIQTDLLLANEPECGIESAHNPFERIFFWQFLHSLISVAWVLYSENVTPNFGKYLLASVLRKFLEIDIFPNARHYKGSVFFEHRNLFPLQAVYDYYLSFGESHTVRKFLNNCCTIKKIDPPREYQVPDSTEKIMIVRGSNVGNISRSVMYLIEPPPEVQVTPSKPPIYCYEEDPFRNNMFLFRKLGSKKILNCIHKVCPTVIEEDSIVDMEYPLTFLEFYEIFLLCARTYVLQEEKKKKKEKETIARSILDEVLTVTEGTDKLSNTVSRRSVKRTSKKKSYATYSTT